MKEYEIIEISKDRFVAKYDGSYIGEYNGGVFRMEGGSCLFKSVDAAERAVRKYIDKYSGYPKTVKSGTT